MTYRSARAVAKSAPAPGHAQGVRIRPARAGAAVPPAETDPLGLATFLGLLPAPAGLTVDVACGGGLLGRHLARAGYAPLVGVAASRDHLTKARAARCYTCVVLAPPTDIPLPAGSAELVSCFATWDGLSNLDAHIAAAARLLRPGGQLAATVLDPGVGTGRDSLTPQLHATLTDDGGQTLLVRAWHYPPAAYVAALERAGLRVETVHEHQPWLYLGAVRPR